MQTNFMRIIIVTQTFPPKIGGMQSVMKSLAEELSSYFQIVVLPNNYVKKECLNKGLNKIKIKYFYIPKIFKPLIKKIYLFFFSTKEDVFICDSWKSIAAIPKKFNKSIYVLAHGQEYLNAKKNDSIKKSLARVSAVISNSFFTKKLSSKFLISDIKNYVIPPTYMLPNTVIKKKFSLIKSINFITISRIEERKGLLQSISALSEINKKYPTLKFKWNIIGIGPQLPLLKEYVKKSNLNQIIKFHGIVNDTFKNNLLRNSHVFVMPSYKINNSVEGFGIVYAEALRYGIPSVAGIDGGVTDVIKNNENGWNINPLNILKLQELFLWVINHPNEINKLGKQSQIIYLKKFTKNNSINKLLKIIH